MQTLRHNLLWIMMPAMALAAWAAPPRHPITAQQVSSALNAAGLQVTASQITLPGAIVATTAEPVLRTQSIQPMPDHSTVVRIECENSSECLPFFVKLHLGQNRDQAAVSAPMDQPLPAGIGQLSSRRSALVHSGSRATLLLEGQHVQIRIPVVCIENGGLGQKVRVRGAENRQVYVAEVVDAALLKGTL
jgi:hypothetical protein